MPTVPSLGQLGVDPRPRRWALGHQDLQAVQEEGIEESVSVISWIVIIVMLVVSFIGMAVIDPRNDERD